VAATVVLGWCGGGDSGSSGTSKPEGSGASDSPSAPAGTLLVALGDSDTSGEGDPTGKGWVGAYAQLVQDKTGRQVEVRSHAASGQTSEELLSLLRSDTDLQSDITAADFIVIGTGGADINIGDDALLGGSCPPQQCYETMLKGFAANIEAIAAQISTLRAGKPVVLRAITLPNIVPGAEDVIPAELVGAQKRFGVLLATSLRTSTCAAMRAHGGQCIDVMTRFNGADGRGNAYRTGLLNHEQCCYPSTKGQQLMAEMLFDRGIEPQALH
jgi:lysophospholipase L1-like esterase